MACFFIGVVLGLSLLFIDKAQVIQLSYMMQPPSAAFLLGTDELGRDMLSRLGQGIILSFGVGLSVLLCSAFIGIGIGLLSGWCGRWIDVVLMRITDVFLSFPGILLAIAFAALAGPGIITVILALSLSGWVGFARLTRVQTLVVRQQEYVHAAQLEGVPVRHILLKHILPNISAPLLVEAAFIVAGAMLAEAGLSFLGIGINPPTPSLGGMLREGARYLLVAPHLVLFPGIVLTSLVLIFNTLGDKARDKLDKRTQHRLDSV